MVLKFYNSLSRELEVFTPINDGNVGLYTCGPTVYNYPHIGNYRAYIFADILKRTLLYAGYDVTHIMNITDIDDKTIRDSQKEGKTLKDFTEFYTQEFFVDRDALNILPANKYTKATEYIDEMIRVIEKLIEKGFAYKSDDGSVYFNIAKDPEYGKLTRLDLDAQKANAQGRIKSDEYEKDNVQDFALWKSYDATDGDVFWETALGKGHPGWHIECSAMSMKNLGEHFDIHTGGKDNMFPHHENEIAQSECATGKKFVNYWLHNEWLLVDGKKMAKSANNFYTLRDIEKKGYSPLVFRYLALQNSYRTPLNFTFESMDAAKEALNRLYGVFRELPSSDGTVDAIYQEKFKESIGNDLGIPQGIGLLWGLIKDEHINPENKRATILDFDRVLGLGFEKIGNEELPAEIEALKQEREIARNEKNWTRGDELRKNIEEKGYTVKDTEQGQVIYKN